MRTIIVPLKQNVSNETRSGGLATPEGFMGKNKYFVFYLTNREANRDLFFYINSRNKHTVEECLRAYGGEAEYITTMYPRTEELARQQLEAIEEFHRSGWASRGKNSSLEGKV